jgi:hypothetical protein
MEWAAAVAYLTNPVSTRSLPESADYKAERKIKNSSIKPA